MLASAAAACIGYALGSIPTGYLVVRWRTGRDVRTLDSGSTGARNVGRQVGLAWGWASGIGDTAKGAAAVMLARRLVPNGWVAAMPGAVAGHVWPITLGFHGGRGIATALGAALVADPAVGATTVAAFLAGITVTRATRPSIVLGLAAAPVAALGLRRPPHLVSAVFATVAVVAAGHASHFHRVAARPTNAPALPGGRPG